MSEPIQPVSSETAALARMVMSKLGSDGPLTVGSPTSGESYALPDTVATLVRQVLSNLAAGQHVTIARSFAELTPNEAADELNVSRTYVMKLLQDGVLPFRMVGNHHRIPIADVIAYKDREAARQRTAMDQLYEIDRQLGIVDGPPPPRDAFKADGGRGA